MGRINQTLIAALLMTTSCCAIAGKYSDAVDKQSKCESAGELAKSFYGLPREKLIEAMNDISRDAKENIQEGEWGSPIHHVYGEFSKVTQRRLHAGVVMVYGSKVVAQKY